MEEKLIAKGKHQSGSAKTKIAKAQTGKGNSNYKSGSRLDVRKLTGLKKGDKRVVHHKNENRRDNRKSNLKVMTNKKHNLVHKRGNNFHKNKK